MIVDIITKNDLASMKDSLIEELLKQISINNISNKEWIRSADAMKILKCSRGTLRNLRISQTLPYSRLGGSIYYSLQDIQKILESNMKTPGKNSQEYGKLQTVHSE